jgi:hypothetical protein
MRKTVQLLAVFMAALYSFTAYAAVDPYEALEVTPAEGTVTSLQHFTITFGDLPVVVNTNAIPTLEKGGGGAIEGTMSLDADGMTVHIDFDECCTASGQYFLNIPENSLTVNNQHLLPLTLRFSISGDADSFYEQITADPAEGVVESLQNFTISFPEYIGDIEYGSMATLRNDKNGKTYRAEMYGVGFKVLAYFPEEVTKAGSYTLTIPEGSVVIYTLGFDVHELTFHYTIEGEEEDPFYDQITIDPAEGAVLGLQNFTISFPETVNGIASGSMATLTCTTNGQTYQADMTASGHDVMVNFPNKIEELGAYTLNIPEASVIINSINEDVAELNFRYYIKAIETSPYTINPPEGEVYLLQNFTIDYGTPVEVNEDAMPVLVNDATGETYECHLIEIGGNAFVYKEYPLSVLGDYTLHVPVACIDILEYGTVNPEMTFHYTVVEKEYYVPTVIDNTPEGEMRLYQRTGYVVREVEKEDVPEGEWPYELITVPQEGSLSIVFGQDNKVYIQRPVSWSYYNGWVEGTLGADGKTITVPMGQYIAYTYSLEMAVQVAVFTYDAEKDSYFYNPDIEELTYTINDDGSISLNGTDQLNILGTMNRAFGQNFQYLDYEWLQDGDYESVYVPIDETPLTPPEGMATETYYLTTAINDGFEWESYSESVQVGFDGDDMWLQGICTYLPDAWIKGTREGNTVTFPNPQLLGAYEVLLYFKAAEFNPINGNTTQKDMVLTFDGENTLYTYDYVFITADKNNLSYINYYQGLTLSKFPDATVEVPQGLKTYEYTIKYKTLNEIGSMVQQQDTVAVGFAGDRVYIQGLLEYLPESWVEGQLVNGQLVLDLPQYMGIYDEEYEIPYPIYLNGFSEETGLLNRQVTLDYNAQTRVFSNPSTPFGFGINKTGYLSVKDVYEALLEPIQTFLPGDVTGDGLVNITDVVALINYLQTGIVSGINLAAGDVDYNNVCNITDVITLINMVLNN